MTKPLKKSTSPVVDISCYAGEILVAEDRPLFDDAVAAGRAGALRAAYVMIWLSCAEALKRRFSEAQKRDNIAGKIVGEIGAKEKDHKAIDRFLLDKAHEYGFISDSGFAILDHVYEMRCLYAHPYEEAPTEEQVSHAASAVVEHVLSKPVKLRHGFGKQLLKDLLENPSYLDDHSEAVIGFTKEILPRIDESIYPWLLENYWAEMEVIADDSSMSIFLRRGFWFCRTMLAEVGVCNFPEDYWHARCNEFPKTLMRVCSSPELFKDIGTRAQDTIVGLILNESNTYPTMLIRLERLNTMGLLSDRQRERFDKHISTLPITALRSSKLKTKTCVGKIIEELRTHNWYSQNPAIDFLVSNGPEQVAELEEEQQILLGRNILQAADGDATFAVRFLENLSEDGTSWPFGVLHGIALELFINEHGEIRFKFNLLDRVLASIHHLKEAERDSLMSEIASLIGAGNPKRGIDRRDFSEAIDAIVGLKEFFPWVSTLEECLQAKAASVPDDD